MSYDVPACYMHQLDYNLSSLHNNDTTILCVIPAALAACVFYLWMLGTACRIHA